MKVYVEAGKREEFFRKLKNYFAEIYGEVEYSEGYTLARGFLESDPQGNICFLQTPQKTLLTIDELDEYIIITANRSREVFVHLRNFLKREA